MSDIKAGDLVLLYKPCPHCGNDSEVGAIFVATGISRCVEPTDCCGNRSPEIIVEDGHPQGGGQLLRCCKRIPPLNELEDVKREEKINA